MESAPEILRAERQGSGTFPVYDAAKRVGEGYMGIPERRRQELTTSQAGIADENRRLRRLQILMSMVTSVISQDPEMTVEEAAEMAANTRRAALAMFPGKELAFDLLYKPRLQRLLSERFRLQ